MKKIAKEKTEAAAKRATKTNVVEEAAKRKESEL